MNKMFLLTMLAVCTASAFAQNIDTKYYVTHFFKLSQNDFEINSKSKVLDEQKAYTTLKDADIDGGKADGVITYSEYLAYLNKNTPNSITPFDFSVSKVLPFLQDFKFIDNGDSFASGILNTPYEINNDLVLPVGSTINLFKWGGLRITLLGDINLKGLSIKGSKDTPVDMGVHGDLGFVLGSFQLTKDAVINGVSCKATAVDVWDINIELQGDGTIRRASLADKYVNNGITFLPDEKVALTWGKEPLVESAVLVQDRVIQGKSVVAYSQGILDRRNKGFWGGNTPDIFFEQGKIRMCYEKDKVIAGVTISGTNQYYYAADGEALRGLSPINSYFLGYPVALDKLKQSWDWSQPAPSVSITDGKAQFTLDIGVQISGKPGIVSLPAGTKLTVDIKTGCCLSVIYPDGKTATYSTTDQMKPAQVAVEQQPTQIRVWTEQWLKDNPEKTDGSNRDIRQGHIALRDKMLLIEKQMNFLKDVLLYKDKAAALKSGNVAIDLNGDGKIQDLELVPESVLEPGNTVFSAERLFTLLVEKVAMLPLSKLKLLGAAMATIPIASATEDLGAIDKLGSILSKAGIHPFAAKKIYYFPNGSGDKVLCRNIEFFPSGMPKKIKLEIPKEVLQKDITSLIFSIPSQTEKLFIWSYSYEHLEKNNPGNKQTNGYWHDANEVEFWESGSLSRIGNFAHAKVLLPAEYGCMKNPTATHNILWTKEGRVYQLVPAGDGDKYILSDKMSISYLYSITWMNIPQCKFAIGLENAIAVDLFFKKGQYTLYNEDPKTKQLIPYTKVFDKDTMVTVIGGFWVNAQGDITRYWGEKK